MNDSNPIGLAQRGAARASLAAVAAFTAIWLVFAWPWLSGRVTIPWDGKAHFAPQVQFLAASDAIPFANAMMVGADNIYRALKDPDKRVNSWAWLTALAGSSMALHIANRDKARNPITARDCRFL